MRRPTAPISLERKSTSLPPKLCQSLPEPRRYFTEPHPSRSVHNEQQPLPGKLMLRVRFPQNLTKLAAVFQFDRDITVREALEVIKQVLISNYPQLLISHYYYYYYYRQQR